MSQLCLFSMNTPLHYSMTHCGNGGCAAVTVAVLVVAFVAAMLVCMYALQRWAPQRLPAWWPRLLFTRRVPQRSSCHDAEDPKPPPFSSEHSLPTCHDSSPKPHRAFRPADAKACMLKQGSSPATPDGSDSNDVVPDDRWGQSETGPSSHGGQRLSEAPVQHHGTASASAQGSTGTGSSSSRGLSGTVPAAELQLTNRSAPGVALVLMQDGPVGHTAQQVGARTLLRCCCASNIQPRLSLQGLSVLSCCCQLLPWQRHGHQVAVGALEDIAHHSLLCLPDVGCCFDTDPHDSTEAGAVRAGGPG